jgi:hypothetical protein
MGLDHGVGHVSHPEWHQNPHALLASSVLERWLSVSMAEHDIVGVKILEDEKPML